MPFGVGRRDATAFVAALALLFVTALPAYVRAVPRASSPVTLRCE